MASPRARSGGGQIEMSLNTSDYKAESVCTALLTLGDFWGYQKPKNVKKMEQPILARELSMPEFRPSNKKKTSSAKSKSSRKRTRKRKLSKISPVESTSRERGCVEYWNSCTKEWSKSLWSCTETDLRDSQLNYWSTHWNNTASNSWYTLKTKRYRDLTALSEAGRDRSSSLKTCSPSPPSLWRLITENERQKREGDVKLQAKKKRKQARSQSNKKQKEGEPKPLLRAKKVRVFASGENKILLKQWFGVVRRAYNIAVNIYYEIVDNNKKGRKFESKHYIAYWADRHRLAKDATGRPKMAIDSKTNTICHIVKEKVGHGKSLKNVMRRAEKHNMPHYVKVVPREIRVSGILDFLDAIKSTKAREDEQKIASKEQGDKDGKKPKKSKFKYRSRKDRNQTFEINARDWNAGLDNKKKETTAVIPVLFKKKLGWSKNDPYPDRVDNAVRVSMDKLGRVYCHFLRNVREEANLAPPITSASKHSTCALDPGVRTFQTIYDADGHAVEWGEGDMKTIFYLCRRIDKLQSKMSTRKKTPEDIRKGRKGKSRATYQRRRAFHRLIGKVKNKISEVHRKLALYLCSNYRTILIPKFDVKRMIKKQDRKLNAKTARAMTTWSHYKFRQLLLAKAETMPWCEVVVVNEAYTSKTCGYCGTLNRKLGSSKTFRCSNVECGIVADRDIHASRNILLRYLTTNNLRAQCVA